MLGVVITRNWDGYRDSARRLAEDVAIVPGISVSTATLGT